MTLPGKTKRIFHLTMITVLTILVAASIWFMAHLPAAQSIKLPDGSNLTLLSVSYGPPYLPAPDPNPIKRAWLQLRSKFKPKKPLKLGYEPQIIFWFLENPSLTQPIDQWMVVLDDASKPMHSARLTGPSIITQKGRPDMFGVVIDNCPTNCPLISLSLYKYPTPASETIPRLEKFNFKEPFGHVSSPASFHLPAEFHVQESIELDPTNFIGRITVPNPAVP